MTMYKGGAVGRMSRPMSRPIIKKPRRGQDNQSRALAKWGYGTIGGRSLSELTLIERLTGEISFERMKKLSK